MERQENNANSNSNSDIKQENNFSQYFSEFQQQINTQIADLTERANDLSEIALNKKVFKRFSFCVSIAALAISIVSICTSLKAFSIDNTAYVGWIIAVLSSLIVILMGWQIFNIIELKGYKEAINEKIEQRLKLLRKDIESLKIEFELSVENKLKELSDEIPERLENDIRRQLRAKGINW